MGTIQCEGGEFSSPKLVFHADSYLSNRSTPILLTAACKRSQSFCQKWLWQVTAEHTYTLDPTIKNGLTMLSKHSKMSSYISHQGMFVHSHFCWPNTDHYKHCCCFFTRVKMSIWVCMGVWHFCRWGGGQGSIKKRRNWLPVLTWIKSSHS